MASPGVWCESHHQPTGPRFDFFRTVPAAAHYGWLQTTRTGIFCLWGRAQGHPNNMDDARQRAGREESSLSDAGRADAGPSRGGRDWSLGQANLGPASMTWTVRRCGAALLLTARWTLGQWARHDRTSSCSVYQTPTGSRKSGRVRRQGGGQTRSTLR